MNGMPWTNDAEHIAFLEQQLQFAVTRLREVESMYLMQYKQIERNLEEHHRVRHQADAKLVERLRSENEHLMEQIDNDRRNQNRR